jgi:hypothetical protein
VIGAAVSAINPRQIPPDRNLRRALIGLFLRAA